MNTLKALWHILQLRGPAYLVYLATGYAWPIMSFALVSRLPNRVFRYLPHAGLLVAAGLIFPIGWIIAGPIPAFFIMIGICLALMLGKFAHFHWKLRQVANWTDHHRATSTFHHWQSWITDPDTRTRIKQALAEASGDTELVIGRIDNDGLVLPIYGPLPDVTLISQEGFNARYRFNVDIIILDGYVLIRKELGEQRRNLFQEWTCLAALHGKVHVPSVYKVDIRNNVIYKALIPGRTLRDIMVDAGADILSASTAQDPALDDLSPIERIEAVWARGREAIPECMPPDFVDQLEQELSHIHAHGVAGVSLTFGNIVITDDGAPCFFDFDNARLYPSTHNALFRHNRDIDRQKFNRIYGYDLMTEKQAQNAINILKDRSAVLPVDLGDGHTLPRFWSKESANQRWQKLEALLLPWIEGQNILDLGSQDGVMACLMLKLGAQVVHIHTLSRAPIDAIQSMHRLFEWQDIRTYPLMIVSHSLEDFAGEDSDNLDIVTMFDIHISYNAEWWSALFQHTSQIASTIIIQADERFQLSQMLPSRTLQELMTENGYMSVDIYPVPGYDRPLLLGQTHS